MAESENKAEEVEVDDGFTVWEKPDGTLIKLNNAEATIEKAKELGWKKTKKKG